MGSILQDYSHIGRVTEGNKTKTSAASRFAVFHHHAVDDFAVTAEVALKIFLGCFPW